jgi:colanic acid/amylovoran biosynthesis glycosyltransferase
MNRPAPAPDADATPDAAPDAAPGTVAADPEPALLAGGGRLAILSPTFGELSQTFIDEHVRTLAPGRTVLVSTDGRGTERFGCPVLSHVQPAFTAWGRLDGLAKDLLFRARRRFGPALAFDDRMRLAAFLKEQDVRVMLAEYGPMGALAGDVCARLGIPLHVVFHGLDASKLLRHATIRRRYRRLFTQAASIVCVSRYLADRLVAVGCPERLIEIVPCGVDTGRFTPGTPEPGRLLALGRLVDKKAPHLSIRAFAAVAARFPEARLDVVGDGPLRARCEAEVAAHGLAGRVTLHGSRPHAEARALMRRAAVFVQHSVTAADGDTEGFPVAISEAMATGLPVVSTRHSGIPDGVLDGETGLLVAEGDVEAMAAAIARLLEDPALAARMGAAGRARAVATLDQARIRARLQAILGLAPPAAAALPGTGAPA